MSGGLFTGKEFNPYSKIDGMITGAIYGLVLSIFPFLLFFLIGIPWARQPGVIFLPLGCTLIGSIIGLFLTRKP